MQWLSNMFFFVHNLFFFSPPDVEWVNINHRTFAGVILSLDWTIGSWILVGIACFVNEWRMLTVAVTSPLIISVITWRDSSFMFYTLQHVT